MYTEVFSIRIKQIRKDLGLTQHQVSKETGIFQCNLSKYETGKLEPDLESLGILANYYQISIDWLLGNPWKSKRGEDQL